jgi:hypothetical protein
VSETNIEKKTKMSETDIIEFSSDLQNGKILIIGNSTYDTALSIANSNKDKHWAVWCGDETSAEQWEKTLGSNVFKADDKGMENLIKIVEYQEKQIRLYKRILKKPVPKEFEIGLLFDNVPKNFFDTLFSSHNCRDALMIIMCRKIKQLPPSVHCNMDYLFILNHSEKIWEALRNEFIPFPSYESFLKVANCETNENKSLVLNNCKSEILFQLYTPTNVEDVKLSPIEWSDLDNVVPRVSPTTMRTHDLKLTYPNKCVCQLLNETLDTVTRELSIAQNSVKALQDSKCKLEYALEKIQQQQQLIKT